MKMIITLILTLPILVLYCCDNNQESNQAEIDNLAASVYDSKTEAKSKIFTPDVVDKNYETILELYGKPANSVYVNSVSAKGRMPLYLVNYLSSSDTLITVKVCRWNNDSLYI